MDTAPEVVNRCYIQRQHVRGQFDFSRSVFSHGSARSCDWKRGGRSAGTFVSLPSTSCSQGRNKEHEQVTLAYLLTVNRATLFWTITPEFLVGFHTFVPLKTGMNTKFATVLYLHIIPDKIKTTQNSTFLTQSSQYFISSVLCCHCNKTRTPIACLPNNAQLESTPYHSPKLHPGPCSSVGMRRGTQTHCIVFYMCFSSILVAVWPFVAY